MDHPEARELLELAAVEPDGYGRLAAGDTAEAAALAGHLAGCAECAAEAERLAAVSATLREVVRSMPPPDLRERTLAFVAATGRPRGASSDVAVMSGSGPVAGPVDRSAGSPAAGPTAGPAVPAVRTRARSSWLAVAAAACLVVGLVGVTAWWGTSRQLDDARTTAAQLEEATTAAIELAAAPDARTVTLAPPASGAQSPDALGRLVYSVERGDLVVMATGLGTPTEGAVYRCWVEDAGGRRILGDMELSGELAYWAGWSDALAGVGADARFGVSLVPAGATSGTPVLVGS